MIEVKDLVSWALTATGLVFVFSYSRSRIDRDARSGLVHGLRDLIIDTEATVLRSMHLPGSDGSQLERYIDINSKFKRLQGLAGRLQRCRNGLDVSDMVIDLKRIATGGDGQSVTRAAVNQNSPKVLAMGTAVNNIIAELDAHAGKKFWFG